MTFSLRQLQAEQRPWVVRNFTRNGVPRPNWMPLLGLGEELGELTEALVLKKKDEKLDAIADFFIFAADLCSALEWDVQNIWDHERNERVIWLHEDQTAYLLICMGKVQHHFLKAAQGIRGSAIEHHREIRAWLGCLFHELIRHGGGEAAVLEAIEQTWKKVSQRDWKTNPNDAHLHTA